MVSTQQESNALREAGPRMKILVIDDDVSMRELMKLHLANAGHSVVVAEDAVVAGRTLLRWTPDVILLDVELPFLSGIEFAATLVADTTMPAIPIILISAHEYFAGKADALGLHFLLKPFTKAELLQAVARSNFKARILPATVSHPSRLANAARALRQPAAALDRS